MEDKNVARPHALLLPYPFLGHLNPCMELGKRLAALGVRVTLATTEPLHAKIAGTQEALSQLGLDFTLIGVPMSSGPPPAFDLEDGLVEVVQTLAAQGHPVTCIVGDFFNVWVPSLARRTGLPEFLFWPFCAAVFHIFLHVEAVLATGYKSKPISGGTNIGAAAMEAVLATGYKSKPISSTSSGTNGAVEGGAEGAHAPAGAEPDAMEVVGCIPGLPSQAIRYADLPFQGLPKEPLDWVVETARHRARHLPEAEGVLVNSFQALEPEVYKALTHHLQHLPRHAPPIYTSPSNLLRFVGPLLPLAGEVSGASVWEEESNECIEWLDGQPPSSVVFVSFGSVAQMSNIKQVQEVAKGLVASGQRFLWVFRKDSMQDMELKDALPAGFLEQTHHIGKIVHWAPQVKVLSHPSIGGFFSHCGWNSILESMNSGVPILGWPSFVDQIPDCRIVSHVWKMGQALELNADREVTSDEVERGVRQLMEGPHREAMRKRATQLQCLSQEFNLPNSHELLSFVDDISKHASHFFSTGLEKDKVDDLHH